MASAPGPGAVCHFDELPVAVLRHILIALPADLKGRVAMVCRAWRDVLSDAAMWEVLDLSATSGVARRRILPALAITPALALGAAARAAGGLRVVNLGACWLSHNEVVALVEANAATLREVHLVDDPEVVEHVKAVLAAAPQLPLLYADVCCSSSEAGAVLRNEPPYGPLRARYLYINCRNTPPAVLLEVAAAVAAHSQLQGLLFEEVSADDPAIVDALFDAARERRVPHLQVETHRFFPANNRALARLLQCDTLTSLSLRIGWEYGIDEYEFELLVATLRGAIHLETLALDMCLWNHANFGVMIAALQELRLQELNLGGNSVQDQAVAGRALGALLAADWPRLHTLAVEYSDLEDEAMAYLLAGLLANTHLRTLTYFEGNEISDDFDRDILTPALDAWAARSAAR